MMLMMVPSTVVVVVLPPQSPPPPSFLHHIVHESIPAVVVRKASWSFKWLLTYVVVIGVFCLDSWVILFRTTGTEVRVYFLFTNHGIHYSQQDLPVLE